MKNNRPISDIINHFKKTMDCFDLLTIKDQIITYINDNVANNPNKDTSEEEEVIMTTYILHIIT